MVTKSLERVGAVDFAAGTGAAAAGVSFESLGMAPGGVLEVVAAGAGWVAAAGGGFCNCGSPVLGVVVGASVPGSAVGRVAVASGSVVSTDSAAGRTSWLRLLAHLEI